MVSLKNLYLQEDHFMKKEAGRLRNSWKFYKVRLQSGSGAASSNDAFTSDEAGILRNQEGDHAADLVGFA